MSAPRASYTAWREIGADLGPHDLVDVVGGAVRSVGHRAQHRQALGRDLQAVLAEQRTVVDGWVPQHGLTVRPILDRVNILCGYMFVVGRPA